MKSEYGFLIDKIVRFWHLIGLFLILLWFLLLSGWKMSKRGVFFTYVRLCLRLKWWIKLVEQWIIGLICENICCKNILPAWPHVFCVYWILGSVGNGRCLDLDIERECSTANVKTKVYFLPSLKSVLLSTCRLDFVCLDPTPAAFILWHYQFEN